MQILLPIIALLCFLPVALLFANKNTQRVIFVFQVLIVTFIIGGLLDPYWRKIFYGQGGARISFISTIVAVDTAFLGGAAWFWIRAKKAAPSKHQVLFWALTAGVIVFSSVLLLFGGWLLLMTVLVPLLGPHTGHLLLKPSASFSSLKP
jgi:hypothetical protein